MPASLRPPPPNLLNGAALFLDFDGTLVELAESPDSIRVPHGLHPLLERLSRTLSGRLAIVSGRAVEDLEGHLAGGRIALSGSHGLELRFPDGSFVPVVPPAGLAEAAREARAFACAEGLLLEEKPAGIALHYRRAPEREEAVRAFAAALAERTGLSVQPGKMVFELRPAGAHKGDAVRRLMAEPAFAGGRPLFVGDDLTDENAFEAAAALGGGGILVGSPRPTAALWRLASVAEVTRWLEEAAGRA
jgi:trehalose 6-phosphate phosphatase